MNDRAERRRELGSKRADSPLRPLWDFERTAYGFIALDPESCLRDSTWEMQPCNSFRPTCILAWPAGEREGVRPFETASVAIESVLCDQHELLPGGRGVPASAFAVPITPEGFLSLYLERPRHREPRTVLIGERIKVAPLDAPSWLIFPTVTLAGRIAIRFKGALVGLVVVGHELISENPSAADH